VWVNSTGTIFASPNVNVWPRSIGEAGPTQALGTSNIAKAAEGYNLKKPVPHIVNPYILGWADPVAPHGPMFINDVLPSYGPLKALSWSAEPDEVLISSADGHRPRCSQDMMRIERKLYDVIDILYSRHAFHLDPTLPLVTRARVPGWWHAWIPDKSQALKYAQLARLHILDLCAVMTLYCAIAWFRTGERDAWLATVQAHGMDSDEDRLWLEEMRASFVCRFDHVGRTGAFFDIAQYPHRALIDVFMLAKVPMILKWGKGDAYLKRQRDVAGSNGSAKGLSARFIPSSEEVLAAARVSSEPGSANGAVVTVPPRVAGSGEDEIGIHHVLYH
jgi:hypothetical protein